MLKCLYFTEIYDNRVEKLMKRNQVFSRAAVIMPIYILLGCILLTSCAGSGAVTTMQADSTQEIVLKPSDFLSPIDQMLHLSQVIEDYAGLLSLKINFRGQEWHEMMSIVQAYDALNAEQSAAEAMLSERGEIVLQPGKSYSFIFESYCVNPGPARPATGDELRFAELSGPAQMWLPEILKNQAKLGVSQKDVQILIWALLSGVRYDELTGEEQATALKFYPDAQIRFGNGMLEDMAGNIFHTMTPSVVSGVTQTVEDYKIQFFDLRNEYNELSKRFAPKPSRTTPILVGWMKMADGYFLKASSYEGHAQTRIDIYVPNNTRGPSAELGAIIFRPWQWIGLPAEGQRIALSTKTNQVATIAADKAICKKIQSWHPKHCIQMSDAGRDALLKIADPISFPKTRYQSPPKFGSSIEEETDCSGFVNEVWRRAGYEYPYTATSLFRCLNNFQPIPIDQSRAGDVILYKGHIGIIDRSGLVISATRGGIEKRSTRESGDKNFLSSISRLSKENAGIGTWQILRWSCP